MTYSPRLLALAKPRHNQQRGMIAVALIIALIILQVAIVGVLVSGTRDQINTRTRLEAIRVRYAALGASQMALREIYLGTDIDGDGGIGSVSNDGNSANDPIINGVGITVARSVSGGSTILTVTATGATCTHKSQITLN